MSMAIYHDSKTAFNAADAELRAISHGLPRSASMAQREREIRDVLGL